MKKIIRFKKRKIFVPLIILIVVYGLFLNSDRLSRSDLPNGIIIKTTEDGSWNTYVNETYGFTINFPNSWRVSEDFERVSPIINIYKPEFDLQAPFDHFANYNNVTIFPRGIETESIIGQTNESELLMHESIEELIDEKTEYILSDKTVWATQINFNKKLQKQLLTWKPWGFVWVRTKILDESYSCTNGSVEILLDECNPFEGDEFIRHGKVKTEDVETLEKIISTFKFL
jgi:hypothetical protein